MAKPNTKRRITSQDVADLAGVSVSTVSLVINNKTGGNVRISDATRDKVLEAVRKLNYRPASAARALRTQRSNLLALLVPFIEVPFQPILASAVQREAEKAGLDVVIYSTQEDVKREKSFVRDIVSRGVDGVILHSHHLVTEDLDYLIDTGTAVVIRGASPTHPFADNVLTDETQAAFEAVSYLISRGHRRIGTITGGDYAWGGRLRLEGYRQAMQHHGIPLDDELIYPASFYDPQVGARGIEHLLSLKHPPTAVFAASDLLAIDAMLYAIDHGYKVPDDIAIMGFTYTREANMVRPRLTSVRKDVDRIASTTLRMLLERINSEEPIPARQEIMPYELVIQDSA